MSKNNTSEDFEKWKTKRRWTYWTYLFQSLETGVSVTVIASVLWEYLKVVPGTNKKLLYGVLACVYNIPPTAFNVLILKWLDKTRRNKEFIIAVNVVSAIGHILFSLPYSPYLLIVGRSLDGFMMTLEPIMTSEIARSYPADELQRKLPLLCFSNMIGFSIGPLLALILGNVNRRVGNFNLCWGNASSFMLFSLNIFQIVFVSFCGHNLSREFDLKEALSQNNENSLMVNMDDSCVFEISKDGIKSTIKDETKDDHVCNEARKMGKTGKASNIGDSTKDLIIKLITQLDLALILFITCFSEFWLTTLYRIFPVMILDNLNYPKTVLTLFFTLYSMTFMSGIYVFTRKKRQNKTAVIIGVIGLISFFIVALCVRFISPKLEVSLNVTLLVATSLSFAISELSESFFVSVTFAQMASSKNQGVAEGIRGVFKRLGTIFGAIFALYTYQYIQYTALVLLATIAVALVGIFLNRKTYVNPKIVF